MFRYHDADGELFTQRLKFALTVRFTFKFSQGNFNMGVYAQLNAQKKTFNDQSPLGVWLAQQLAKAGIGSSVDPPVPSAAAAINSVFNMATDAVDHTGGDFTVTLAVRQADGTIESVTTAAIAYNATAATIEGAIDTAMTSASFTGWTNGDVSVAAGATTLQDGDMTFTADGTSVAGRIIDFSVADSRTGGTSGANTVTARGQTERAALGVLLALNVISGSVPEQDAATSVTAITDSENRNHNIPANIVKALMREVAAEDANNSTYHSIDAALWGAGEDRAPMVEERVTADNTKPV